MSAQKLSSPNEDPIFDKRMFMEQPSGAASNLISFNAKSPSGVRQDWKEAVEKRIAAKTRIKSTVKINSKKTKSKENVYSDVYGYFFFPLLNSYDKYNMF
jgi:hypothetical protein